jgi:hypothetical protein
MKKPLSALLLTSIFAYPAIAEKPSDAQKAVHVEAIISKHDAKEKMRHAEDKAQETLAGEKDQAEKKITQVKKTKDDIKQDQEELEREALAKKLAEDHAKHINSQAPVEDSFYQTTETVEKKAGEAQEAVDDISIGKKPLYTPPDVKHEQPKSKVKVNAPKEEKPWWKFWGE